MRYFTRKLELVLDILWAIVVSLIQIILNLPPPVLIMVKDHAIEKNYQRIANPS